MIIEHAERFGLSQLHQLRGRVGRGEYKSYCIFVLGSAVSDEARRRVEIMERSGDGFKIAEADLELRGPGEFLGTRQSGLLGFKIADLVRDFGTLEKARAAAVKLIEIDPELKRPEHQKIQRQLKLKQSNLWG
jgi:ATP-dependent DNA helicase RecG